MSRAKRRILAFAGADEWSTDTTAPARWEAARRAAARLAMLWVLLVLAVMSEVLYPGFFDIANLRNMLDQNAPEGLVAVGMTFVIIAGGFDLSVASVYAAGSVAFASFANDMPIGIALLLTLVIGVTAGLINGVIVTRLKVNPFVATLGTSSVFGGLALAYSHQQLITPSKASFGSLDGSHVVGIPTTIIIFALAFAIAAVVLAKTVFGRSVYAVGGNLEAARLAGIRVDLVRTGTYVLTGFCAALAGAIIASRTGVGEADIGANLTLDTIAMVIIGGTSLYGGEGSLWRTLLGLLILSTINNLFDSLALSVAVQDVVLGAIVVGAVALEARLRRGR